MNPSPIPPKKPPDIPVECSFVPSPSAFLTVDQNDEGTFVKPSESLTQKIYDETLGKHKKKKTKSSKKKKDTHQHDLNRQLSYGNTSNSSASEMESLPSQCSNEKDIHIPLTQRSTPVNTAKDLESQSQTLQSVGSSNSQPQPFIRPYKESDPGPFVIHVQRIESNPTAGTTLHPISFGRFVRKSNIKNILDAGIKRIGRNRLSIQFNKPKDANDFVENPIIHQNNYKAFIPSFNVSRLGVIRGVPDDWSPEDIVEELSSYPNKFKALKVRRINFKTFVDGSPQWKPSQTVIVTFDGQVLPERVFLCYNSIPVELYQYPVIQCFQCCKFGHTKNICRSKPRCAKCGSNHTSEECDVEDDCYCCIFCSGNHKATDNSCPEYGRQKNIKMEMAEKSISYLEACKNFPPVKASYAEIASSPPSSLQRSPPIASNSNLLSHRKTVFLKPAQRAPLQKGFDKKAHQAVINEFAIPQPANGCALQSKQSQDICNDVEPDIVNILIDALLKMFSNGYRLPSNAASKLNKISSLFLNIHSNDNITMEL